MCETQVGPTLCNPMDYSMLGFPVLCQLLEFAQTHVHWVDDAIQISHPLLSLSPPALNLSHHQGLFQSRLFESGSLSIGASAPVLPMTIQGWFPLGLTDFISLLSKGLSRVFSSTTVQKHQFFTTQLSLYFIFIFYGREWKMELRSIEEKRTKEHIENLNERGNLKFSVAEDIGMSF